VLAIRLDVVSVASGFVAAVAAAVAVVGGGGGSSWAVGTVLRIARRPQA